MDIILDGFKPLAPNTKLAYQYAFNKYQKWCACTNLQTLPADKNQLIAYLNFLAKNDVKPPTMNAAIRAIRHQCYINNLPMCHNTFTALNNCLAQYKQSLARNGQAQTKHTYPIKAKEMGKLLQIIDAANHKNATRDGAAFALAWAGALRISEITELRLNCLSKRHNAVRLKLLHSKGDRNGQGTDMELRDFGRAWNAPGLLPRLALWEKQRTEFFACPYRRPMLRPQNYFGYSHPAWFRRAVEYWNDRARMPHLKPHSFRAGFAQTMAEAGMSLPQLQTMMRHNHPSTTAIYYKNMDLRSVSANAEKLAART